jgi:uroporphyrinogen-III synthase
LGNSLFYSGVNDVTLLGGRLGRVLAIVVILSLTHERTLAFETRRATELQTLLGKQGGGADFVGTFVEAPMEANHEAMAFGGELLAGQHPMVICLTGIAVRRLLDLLRTRYEAEALQAALQATYTVARGPKPSLALRDNGVTPRQVIAEPSTWRELLPAIAERPERSVAVVEYGRPDERLLRGLLAQGRAVRRVPVYQYELPADVAPIEGAIDRLIAGEYTLLLFTSSIQFQNLAEVAGSRLPELVAAMNRARVASIGPTMSETLREAGVTVRLEPSHPKLGVFVQEVGARISN